MLSLKAGQVETTYYFVQALNEKLSERHLASLGLVKGAKLKIVSRNKQGNYIVLVKQTRLAVSEDVAENIMVTLTCSEEERVCTLDQLSVGTRSIVEGVTGQGQIRRRLMDMGLTRGVPVYIRKVAPLGDPIEITVRGYELTLRQAEAELVLVKGV